MIRHFFKIITILALAQILSTIAAFGAPKLKPEIVVSSAIVTVGDMFENAGLSAERAMFRAPAPGTKGMVSVNAIRFAAKRAGIEEFETGGLAQVSVARAGFIVKEENIKTLIINDLARRGILDEGIKGEISLHEKIQKIYADNPENKIRLENLEYFPRSQKFNAYFQIAGRSDYYKISGKLSLLINVPYLVNSLPAGAIITANDIEMRPTPMRYAQNNSLTNIEEIIGKQLRRATRKGMMLRQNDISEPVLIRRSQLVTLYYRKGPLTLTAKGQALNSAAKGELVSVLNLTSKNIVTGVAADDGAVEVNKNNTNIALNKG